MAPCVEGHGVMDESYLTGEPYMMSKTPGSAVLSGAINGETALTIRADKLAVDSRYAKIMQVMRASEQRRPRLRRLGDQLGAFYTPLAVAIALAAWAASGEAVRFLAVLVVATPCPLLIAIPVAIIGSISLAARRGIIIKDPAVLEKIDTCRTAIFDKTGTLTYGQPKLTEVIRPTGFDGQGSAGAGRQPGALLEAPAGGRHPGRRAAKAACPLRRPARSASGPARACGDRSPAGRSRSPAARSCSRSTRSWRQDFRRPWAGWNAWSLIDGRYAATLALPRPAAGRGRLVHPPPEAQARIRPRDARLGRPGVGGALPGRAGRHRGGLRRPDARSRKLELVRAGDAAGEHRRSWATASTMPRP